MKASLFSACVQWATWMLRYCRQSWMRPTGGRTAGSSSALMIVPCWCRSCNNKVSALLPVFLMGTFARNLWWEANMNNWRWEMAPHHGTAGGKTQALLDVDVSIMPPSCWKMLQSENLNLHSALTNSPSIWQLLWSTVLKLMEMSSCSPKTHQHG